MNKESKKRHIYADLIHAWAEGAEIEMRFSDKEDWKTIDAPMFNPRREYRIKPVPKPDIIQEAWIAPGRYGLVVCGEDIPNLRCTFDGETGKLKSAEIIQTGIKN